MDRGLASLISGLSVVFADQAAASRLVVELSLAFSFVNDWEFPGSSPTILTLALWGSEDDRRHASYHRHLARY